MDSTNAGNGLFAYTFHRGHAPYVCGVGTIGMQSYGILEIQDPPAWEHSIDADGFITLQPANGLVFLDEPITFSIRSCLAETATYDDWWPPGPYPQGLIIGAVYALPGRTNNLGGGYQGFVFTGPARLSLAIERNGSGIVLRWSTLAQRCKLEATDQLDN